MTTRGEPDEPNTEDAPEDYVSFGYLDPLFGKRIMDHLSRQHIRFTARDASRLDIASAETPSYLSERYLYPRIARHNLIELFAHTEDADLARKIIDEM